MLLAVELQTTKPAAYYARGPCTRGPTVPQRPMPSQFWEPCTGAKLVQDAKCRADKMRTTTSINRKESCKGGKNRAKARRIKTFSRLQLMYITLKMRFNKLLQPS